MTDTWEVKVTAPNGDSVTKLVTDSMVKPSIACSGLNGYAMAASLAVYDLATSLTEADSANSTRKTNQLDGQCDSKVQANGQGQV